MATVWKVYKGLIAPEKYWLLKPEAKKKYCNGAGPKHFGFLVPDTLYGLSITECANIHDYMYAMPEFSRSLCDEIFLKNMVAKAKAAGSWLKKLRIARAHTYYYSVRAFGGLFKKGNF